MILRTLSLAALALGLTLCAPSTGFAQLVAIKDGPIVYGHLHVYVPDAALQKKFWAEALGGNAAAKLGGNEVVKFQNILIFIGSRALPADGAKVTGLHHVALRVPNLAAAVARAKAAGYDTEADGGFASIEQAKAAFVRGPNDTLVELVESPATPAVALDHMHFSAPDVAAARTWYVNTLGAKAGKRGSVESAELPGVSLLFSAAKGPIATNKGQVFDHIGFEVRELEAFSTRLQGMGITLDRPYSKLAQLNNLGLAYITDPWGMSIELNEGQDQ